MSAVDPGLTDAVQRVMEARRRHGMNLVDGCRCGFVGTFEEWQDHHHEAIARAARVDVPALTRQARADELEHFAEHHIRNQSAGRIVEDMAARAAAIREGREP